MILKNAIITPDGTELISEHRHDFKMHKDSITDKEYGVDGGSEYQRLIGDIKDCQVIYITSADCTFVEARELITWGTYGKDGNSPYKRVSLSQMTTGHIKAILETQKQISEELRKYFNIELEYRAINEIPCFGD